MAGTICLRIVLISLMCMVLVCTVTIGEEIRDKHNNTTHDGPNQVIIDSDSHSVEIGDEIILKGIIDKSLIGGAPSDVVILISAPEGSLADTFILSAPDQHGKFSYKLPADVGGTWGFEALYNGVYSPKVMVDVVPSTKAGKTTLTLSGWPVYPRVGDEVVFKGRLTDSSGKGVPNREIGYQSDSSGNESGPNGSSFGIDWDPLGFGQTDQIGEYSFRIPVVQEGEVHVRVLFPGDGQYTQSESKVISLIVKSA